MIDPQLRDKVVLITGVNNPLGIGAATAKAFAVEGARIVGTYLPLPPRPCSSTDYGIELYEALIASTPDQVVAAIHTLGAEIRVIPADLSKPEVIPTMFDLAETEFGPVDILVNNAAHGTPDTFLPVSHGAQVSKTVWDFPSVSISPQTHDSHFSVNSRAVALMMAEFARRVVARGAPGGRIINVSTDGASGFATEVSYGASKHALESYSRAAAKELGRFGITVNIVSLGPVQTGWIGPQLEKEIAARTPLGRVGKPEEVADVIVFLGSHQARWLTGQMLFVGGGHQMPL